jgi:thiol-disulfide isomerase/thioredoxin
MLGGAVVASRLGAGPDPAVAAVSTVPAATAPGTGAIAPDAFPALPSLVVVRNGRPLQLAGPRAKPTLLHLWATWCGPCRDELPALLAYGNSGDVDVVALSVDDEWDAVQRYFGGTMPAVVAWDRDIVVEPAMGVRSLPTTFLIDTAGRVRRSWVGAQPWADPAFRRAVALAGR